MEGIGEEGRIGMGVGRDVFRKRDGDGRGRY